MADLKNDLKALDDLLRRNYHDVMLDEAEAALDRIASAVGELEHLREGARMLLALHELGLIDRDKAYGAGLDRWLRANYAACKAAAEPGKAGGSR